MALGILNAECSCEFDSSENCICTVTGEAQVDSAGAYIVLLCWWEGEELRAESLYAKDVGHPTKFRYEGSFDNTTPKASYYIITLAKSGEEDFIGSQAIIEPEECETLCTPNTKKCIGNEVYVCSSDGMDWLYEKTCDEGYYCRNGNCIKNGIVPGVDLTTIVLGTVAIAGAIIIAKELM